MKCPACGGAGVSNLQPCAHCDGIGRVSPEYVLRRLEGYAAKLERGVGAPVIDRVSATIAAMLRERIADARARIDAGALPDKEPP